MRSHRFVVFLVAFIVAAPRAMAQSDGEGRISSENMCGILALNCAASAAGAAIDVEASLEKLPLDGKMKSFGDLARAARDAGLHTKAVRYAEGRAPDASLPCIVRLAPNGHRVGAHFVVIVAAEHGALRVIDPPAKPIWVTDEEIRKSWDGVALYVARDAASLQALAPTTSSWAYRGSALMAIASAAILLAVAIARRGFQTDPDIVNSAGFKIATIATPVGLIVLAALVGAKAALGLAAAVLLALAAYAVAPSWKRWEGSGPPRISTRPATAVVSIGWIMLSAGLILTACERPTMARESTVMIDQPSLVVESSESSLKASDDIARGEFKLTNRGATPVKIIDITPNCSCAEVVASARTIPVGGFVKIHVGIRMDGESTRGGRLLVELENAIPQRLTLRLTARRTPD